MVTLWNSQVDRKSDCSRESESPTALEVLGKSHVNAGDNGVGIQGYDPVSYFSDTPTIGKTEYSVAHGGLQYRFANQENMARFTSAPKEYLPAYGGWSGWAMQDGKKIDVNP